MGGSGVTGSGCGNGFVGDGTGVGTGMVIMDGARGDGSVRSVACWGVDVFLCPGCGGARPKWVRSEEAETSGRYGSMRYQSQIQALINSPSRRGEPILMTRTR